MRLTPLAKKELRKKIGKTIYVDFGGGMLGDAYFAKLLEFNEDSMTVKEGKGIGIIPLDKCMIVKTEHE